MALTWDEWFRSVGSPPEPFRFQRDQFDEGFVTKPLNSAGPLRGNQIPYAQLAKPRLCSRNVTTLHWHGLFRAEHGTGGGTISLDSGLDAATFLARFGRTATQAGGILAPIQINKNLPVGSRGASKTGPLARLPRCDLDFKIHVPFDEAMALVRQDTTQCLLDMEQLETYHFSTDQVRHHATVIGSVVARMFGLPAHQVGVVVMRAPVPAMDLVRVEDGFQPRREGKETNERGMLVLPGRTVVIKPSYWMIFQLRDHITKPPNRVWTDEPTVVGVTALDINVARLFRVDEVSEPATTDPSCNYQHPGLRIDASMHNAFRAAVSDAMVCDFQHNPGQWTIRGHVVDGLASGTTTFFDDPRGQRLARATKTHDCVYHDTFRTEDDRQVRVAGCPHCPFSMLTHACVKKNNVFKAPVPVVRFQEPQGNILSVDQCLLRSKAMQVCMVIDATGASVPGAMDLVRRPDWGPVVEQAWTSPFVTACVAERSRELKGMGAHLDSIALMHNGRTVARPADPLQLRKTVDTICRAHKWTVPKTLRSDTSLVPMVQRIVALTFECLDTASVQSPYFSASQDAADLFDKGYPYTPLRIGSKSVVLPIRDRDTSTAKPPTVLLVLPVDDDSTGCISLYCELLLNNENTKNALTSALHAGGRSGVVQPSIGHYSEQRRGYPGIPVGELHRACHHGGASPIYFVVQRGDTTYRVEKHCLACKGMCQGADTRDPQLDKVFTAHTREKRDRQTEVEPRSKKPKGGGIGALAGEALAGIKL